jgi:hypothetical protein
MAERAKLTGKDNWRMYPRAMLRARCVAEGVRTVYPAALGGALIVEEALDIDQAATFDAETGAPVQAAPTLKVERRPKAAPTPAPTPAAEVVDAETGEIVPPKPASAPPAAPAADGICGLGEIAYLRNKAQAVGLDLAEILAARGLSLEALPKAEFAKLKAEFMEAGA